GNLSSVNAAMKGNMVLLSTQTASNAASVSFTTGIDSTYKLYIFKFYDVNPATDSSHLGMQFSTDGGSNYGMTVTSTSFYADHYEDDSGAATLTYQTAADLAQSTSDVQLHRSIGGGADESLAGELHLFNPSNTTYVKHFYGQFNEVQSNDISMHRFIGGYVNSTNDIDAIIFRMDSGNMDGVIKMYGMG
ncbi:MAG: hypothetical protein QF535_09760, partial [Anaerolineales bacterium]|nr:hypothetical protein [Anaerolineales bacterium]